MADRQSSFSQRALGDGLTGSANVILDVQRSAIVRGRLVTAAFSAATSVDAKHGLGRRYQGAFVVGQNTGTRVFIVQLPEDGSDPNTFVSVFAYDWAGANTAVTADVNLWVF